MDKLIEQRNTLAIAMYNTETDAFPGTKAYKAYSAAMLALADFDEAHPEVIDAIQGGC